MLNFILLLVISYLLGSIPTSFILGKMLRGIDIREHGSGNAGATNAYRVLGARPALVTVAIDISKGFVPVFFLAPILGTGVGLSLIWVKIIAGLFAVAGHIWTIFLKFRGGKGVATGAGILLALAPMATLVGVIAFIVVTALTRYVSLGSICAACSIPITIGIQIFVLKQAIAIELFYLGLILIVTVVVTHRSNIRRLLTGQERRLGDKAGLASSENQ